MDKTMMMILSENTELRIIINHKFEVLRNK